GLLRPAGARSRASHRPAGDDSVHRAAGTAIDHCARLVSGSDLLLAMAHAVADCRRFARISGGDSLRFSRIRKELSADADQAPTLLSPPGWRDQRGSQGAQTF